MSDLVVNIDHLVLHGSAMKPGEGQHLARMIEAALQILLEQRGWPSDMAESDAPKIIAPHIDAALNAGDEQLSQTLAITIYRALDRRENHGGE